MPIIHNHIGRYFRSHRRHVSQISSFLGLFALQNFHPFEQSPSRLPSCQHSVPSSVSPPMVKVTVPLLARSLMAALQSVYPFIEPTDPSEISLNLQGLQLSAQDVQSQLSRRRPGQSNLTTPVCFPFPLSFLSIKRPPFLTIAR
jgi:hypothetical protein